VVFDGNGHFTRRDYVGDNLAGPDFAPPGQEKGTYTVDPDCTGSATLNLNAPVPMGSTGVISVKFVISDGGRHVHQVVSEYTPPGSNGPVPIQTSVDVRSWSGTMVQNPSRPSARCYAEKAR
jgi:hypothetical protein